MKQILLVEDNPVAQKVAMLNLRDEDCVVDIVVSAKQALDALLKTPYDLVLMDIGLPDMDGYLLTEQIRQSGYDSIVIVGLSAYIGETHEQRCREVGMNAIYPKPLTRDRVASLLNMECSNVI